MKKEDEILDGIVLNAGISPSPPPSVSDSDASSPSPSPSSLLLPLPPPFPEGWSPSAVDDALATNHVGHFALVQGLLENKTIKKGARVVAVSSRASAAGELKKSENEKENKDGTPLLLLPSLAPRLSSPFRSYSRSKLANVLFCRELARRNRKGANGKEGGEGEGEKEGGKEEKEGGFDLFVAATSPGLVRTPLARGFALSAAASAVPSWMPLRCAAISVLSSLAEGVASFWGQSAEKGATSTVVAATATAEEGGEKQKLFPSCSSNFAFFHGRKQADWLLSRQATNGELAAQLWRATEAVVAEARRR